MGTLGEDELRRREETGRKRNERHIDAYTQDIIIMWR
jgi:hypothetical protein